MPPSTIPSTQPAANLVPEPLDMLEDPELMGEELDSLLDCFPTEQETTRVTQVSLFHEASS